MKKAILTKAKLREIERMVSIRSSALSATSWDDAVADFLLLVKGTREEKTAIFYRSRLSVLKSWAKEQGIPLTKFKARYLRQYLAFRADQGVADSTRRHDAVSARAFFKFFTREDYVPSNPLTDYQTPRAGTAYVKCPSDDEIRALLKSIPERWNPSINPEVRYVHSSARRFFFAKLRETKL